MASHGRIRPSGVDLLFETGLNALDVANGLLTRRSGDIWIDTGEDGSGVIAGSSAADGINRVDKDGNMLPLVDTSGIEQDAQAAADKAQAAAAKADQVRSDLQAEVDKVKSDVAGVESKADADKAELDKSITALDKKVSDVSDKGDQMAGQITDITGTLNGQQTKLTEFDQKLEGAVTQGDTTVKSVTELKQTVTGLSSTVSQTTATANEALSKASSVEQTADGLKATISKDYQTTAQADEKYSTKVELSATSESLSASITSVKKTADGAVSAANTAQATADGVKVTLSKDYTSTKDADLKYSTKAELSATSESLSSSISSVKGTADGAVTSASKAQQTADSISATLSKDYQTTAKADEKYSTKTELSATSESLSAKITETAKTASGAMDKASSVEQTASGLSAKITEAAQNADSAVRTANQLKSTVDSNTAKITQVGQTTDGLTTRANTLEQNLDGFKSTVSQTYTPLTQLEELRKSSEISYVLKGVDYSDTSKKWVKLGYLTSNGNGSSILLHVYSGDGYNGRPAQNAEFTIYLKDAWQSTESASDAFGVSVNRVANADDVKVKVMAFSATTCDVWAYLPWNDWTGRYTLQGSYKAWDANPSNRLSSSEPASGTAQQVAYEQYSTKSYVDQTAKTVALGVVQTYQGADGSGLATKSDLTATKDSITSTVSQNYATKDGVSQEISSQITQNNSSLDAKFSTKATVDSVSQRVATQETMIRMDSSGVRVGEYSGGSWETASARMDSSGAFEILDKGSKSLLSISSDTATGASQITSNSMFFSAVGDLNLFSSTGQVLVNSLPLSPQTHGKWSGNTNSTGQVTITPDRPDKLSSAHLSNVQITPVNANNDTALRSFMPVIFNISSTSFTVRLLNIGSRAWASGAQGYAFYWSAFWAA